ncbi:MAG: DUF5024 domain-containing protein [Tannerella sp.]|jgi:hypothetical protein|nr:DUF5024 domain-containing protein [Tannerella sp.]
MKTKIGLLIGLMWLLGSFSMESSAQEAIKALIKKCETLETVDVNIIRHRDRNTKEVTRSVTSIQIHSNPALVKEFQDAFQKAYDDFSKDKKVADREIITRRGGKIVNLQYRYGNVDYSFSVDNDGQDANVSVIERWDEDNGSDGLSFMNFEHLQDFKNSLEDFKNNLEFHKFDKLDDLEHMKLFLQIPGFNFNNFKYFGNISN